MEISKGVWRRGKPYGTVVTDDGDGFPKREFDGENMDFYGGHLIAESIGKEVDLDLILAAPDLLAACEEFVRKVESGLARSTKSYAQMKAAINKARGNATISV